MGLLIFEKDLNTFVFRCTFSEKDIPKRAGFKWDNDNKVWHEPDHARAFKLIEFATDSAKNEINKRTGISFKIPPIIAKSGVKLMKHQHEAVDFILARKNAYYAGDPGVGKTAVAITVASTLCYTTEHTPQVLVICPPFLALNWVEEIKKFARFQPASVEIVGSMRHKLSGRAAWVILPDSLLQSELVRENIIEHGNFDILIADEAHRFKNEKAVRTKALYGHNAKRKGITGLITVARRVLLLSGTPMPNRPIELFPCINALAPHLIYGMTIFEYGLRYCQGQRTEWGWDFSGASNVQELHERVIGTLMLRHSKEDCLDLPAKMIRTKKLQSDITKKTEKLLKNVSGEDIDNILDNPMSELGEMATLRSELSLIKADAAIDFIEGAVEESGKVLVFAWHKKAIAHLEVKLTNIFGPDSVVVNDGSVSMKARHTNVREFQENKKVKVMIGQIETMVGITLTSAYRGIFVEMSWQPGQNEQAMDRLHRIGQTEKVIIDILSIEHDLDERVFKSLKYKEKTISEFLTGETAKKKRVTNDFEH